MPRPASPADLERLRIARDPRLSPDGRTVAFTVGSAAAAKDGYRQALWSAPADGGAPPRQLTLGAKHDSHGRFSPDGRTLAFLSDRRLAVEDTPPDAPPGDREDGEQIHLLPLDGGEARRLTDLPRGVGSFVWSPDGRRLAVLTASLAAGRKEDARRRRRIPPPEPGEPPRSDYRYLDRLRYLFNGRGFIDDRVEHLWVVDAEDGAARRLTDGWTPDEQPAWSPDGRRIAYVTDRSPAADIRWRSDIWVVDVETGGRTRITGGDGAFMAPVWVDGVTLAVFGHRFPARAGSRFDVWLFAADGSESGPTDGRDLSARHDLMPASGMNSDVQPGDEPRLEAVEDGAALLLSAPIDGAYEVWRLAVPDGAVERLTDGRHYVTGWDARTLEDGTLRLATLVATATSPADLWVEDLAPGTSSGRAHGAPAPRRRVTALNDEVLEELELVDPEEHWSTVEGRRIQGWYYPPVGGDRGAAGEGGASGDRDGGDDAAPAPLVLEIHGGPHSLYGWSLMWEWQVLAGAGLGVFACNPRGSEGYGEDFNAANYRDWGDGPMRDVLAGVDALVAEGRADPDRLGVTGGSYGGYLTNWIVGHDQRFRAAVTCRSVSDMTTLMLTGDIAQGDWGRLEFGSAPWEDVGYWREISPLTYAPAIRTPLLIQHAENDLRTTIAQGEALFTILRSLRRPVRFMRVPGETHELTRSGTPFRRVENIVQIRDWFRHYLVEGRRGLPPLPRVRAGR